jgi:MFS superfamily sulfate permease-like transporter
VGAGNVVGSFFQGLPADGSLSRTAHLVNAARTMLAEVGLLD